MSLTFKKVKELVAVYTGEGGSCPTSPQTEKFAKQVMQLLLYEGAHPSVRRFTFCSERGKIVLPKEIEVPIKVKVEGKVSELWGKWFTYNSNIGEFNDPTSKCFEASSVLQQLGEESPLIYDVPSQGSIIGVRACANEGSDAYVIIQGKDLAGREVYTNYRGEDIVGERISLVKDVIQYGKIVFSQVTGVTKPKTRGYVGCYAVLDAKHKKIKYLADWNPAETSPSYAKYYLNVPNSDGYVRVSMLARVKLKDEYDDNELTLFDNTLAIEFAAQRLQAELANNDSTAQYKKNIVTDILEKEAGYKKVSGNPIQVYHPLSGGAIKGIIP